MIKDDIEGSKVSITEMQDTITNSQSMISDVTLFIIKCLNSCKYLAEGIINEDTEKVSRKVFTHSPLKSFITVGLGLINNIKTDYISKVTKLLEMIANKKQQIDQECTIMLKKLEEVLNSLKGVRQLYDNEYMRDIENLDKIKKEIENIRTKQEADKADPFVRYVVSVKERNKRKLKRLILLEKEIKNKVNGVIEVINNELDKINIIQLNLPSVYGVTLTKVLKIFEEILYVITIIDISKALSSLNPLNNEVQKILSMNVQYNAETVVMTAEENSELSIFLYKFMLRFSKHYQSAQSSFESFIADYDKKTEEAKIAILKEWKEQLRNYLKGIIGFLKKSSLHIEVGMEHRLKSASEGFNDTKNEVKKKVDESKLKKLAHKDCERIQHIGDCFNGFFQYIFNSLNQHEIHTTEYVKLLRLTSADLSSMEAISKLKYITLMDTQDESTIVIEKYSSSSEEDSINPAESGILVKKFGISEPVINCYVCALHWQILLQGRLYVTKSFLCFYSSFNNSTIFGKSTKICIPLSDIIETSKAYNALIFDNSIVIRTAKTKFFFTSFLSRDNAYKLIKSLHDEFDMPNVQTKSLTMTSLLGPSKKSYEIDTPDVSIKENKTNQDAEDVSYKKEIKEMEKERIEVATKDYSLKMPVKDPYLDETYTCPIQLLLASLLNKKEPTAMEVWKRSDNKNLTIESESPIPEYFTQYKYTLGEIIKREETGNFISKAKKWPIVSNEDCKYIHILKDSIPIPSFPKEFVIKEKRTVYYLSPNYVIIYTVVSEEGIPYGDHFFTDQWIIVRQEFENNNYKTNWKFYSEMRFVKNTIFRGLIEKMEVASVTKLVSNVTKPLYEEYINKQIKRYKKFIENRESNTQGIVTWIPKVNEVIVGQEVFGELKKSALQLRTINRILKNQKKMHMAIVVGFILLLALVIMYR